MKKYISKIKKCLSCKKNTPKLLLCMVLFAALVYVAIKLIKPLFDKYVLTEGFGKASELLLLHMNGCGHCKDMMPAWKSFENSNNTGIKVSTVEQSENPALVKKHNVKGFPTILLLDAQGNKIKDYSGPRTIEGFKKFCASN
jgi:thiol-disulfide isomerase/thioredoxin